MYTMKMEAVRKREEIPNRRYFSKRFRKTLENCKISLGADRIRDNISCN